MQPFMFRRGSMAFVSLYALACGGPPADTPSAVILLTPDTICQGDAHRTSVTIDGTMSSRHLSLVPLPPEDTSFDPDGAMAAPIEYAWSLDGDEHTITGGSLTSSTITVTAAGDRPLHISLTTRNRVGGTATSLRTLPITVPTTWPRHCSSDAACPGGACRVDDAGGADAGPSSGTCVGAHCSADRNCAPCFVCDTTQMTCVPRTP